MDYLSLLIAFIFFSLVAIALTYQGGIVAGLVGCVLLSLYNAWVVNSILRQRFRHLVSIFFQNMLVTVPIMLCLDTFFKLLRAGQGMEPRLVIYILATVLILWLYFNWNDVRKFKLSEYLKQRKRMRYLLKQRQLGEEISKARKQNRAQLESAYQHAEQDPGRLAEFMDVSTRLVSKNADAPYYARTMAYYSSKLILKGLEDDNAEFALSVFNHYVDKVFPYTGSDHYQTNIIGNTLSLAMVHSLDEVADKVFHTLLGQDFDMTAIDNPLVLYNLACYYALDKQKQNMLTAIRQGLLHGREPGKYRTDPDFSAYLQDADFIKALDAAG